MVAHLTSGVAHGLTTWKLGTEAGATTDTAVSEDAPNWFRTPGVHCLANMRPAFDQHAHVNKHWGRSDTAISANGPIFASRVTGFSVFAGDPTFAAEAYVEGQHTPRSRVQNSLTMFMLDGAVGPRAQHERLADSTRGAHRHALLRATPAMGKKDMPGARQRDILAAFTEAQELLRSGRVGLNDALLHPHARPMSAPPRATLSAALQLALCVSIERDQSQSAEQRERAAGRCARPRSAA
mmetsp:Transcript_45097/g.111816  ORF Transcript_45097/g.111816 Transcript_45097/m.111816 type:complete len:239 (-) Transcript_45097:581-1297(-)